MRFSRWAIPALMLTTLGAGCSTTTTGGSSSASTSPVSTTHDMSSMDMSTGGTTPEGGPVKVECAQHMPGDLLTAEQAMVVFDTEHVCLGYVTVLAGTEVTWHNTDRVDRKVTVLDDDAAVLTSFDVKSGGAATHTVETPGVFRFKVSAIESFVGTIEVQKKP